MSLTEVCALLTVVIGLLTLLVTVAKASFDAGWKISHDHDDKNKKAGWKYEFHPTRIQIHTQPLTVTKM